MEVEVREFFLDFREILEVERLDEGAGTVEEVDFLLGLERLEQVHDVAAERGHAGAATHEDVLLAVRIFRKQELTVRTADPHLVAWLAREHVGRGDARRHRQHLEDTLRLAAVERRRRDTDVELDDVLLGRIRSHGVGTDRRHGVLVLEVEETVLLPVGAVDRIHVHVGEIDVVDRDVDLDVFTALELDVLAFRQLDRELLDEGGHVLVGDDLALELLDAEGGVGHLDLEIVLDLHLAAEAPVVGDLLAGEEADLRGEDASAALEHLALALAAVALAAAGRRKEDLLLGERVEERAALRDVEHLLAVVDIDLDRSGRGEFNLDEEEQGHQDEGDHDNHEDRCKNRITHNSFLLLYREIPMNVMKAMPMRPTTMKVMPRPLSGAGTFE